MTREDRLKLFREVKHSGVKAIIGDYIHDGVLYGYACCQLRTFIIPMGVEPVDAMPVSHLAMIMRSVVESHAKRTCFALFVPNTWLLNYINPELKMLKDPKTGKETDVTELLRAGNFMPVPQLVI